MERGFLIAMLVGYYVARSPNINPIDAKIEIDNRLIQAHMPPLTDTDNDLLQDLISETAWFVISKRVNREKRRKEIYE